MIDSLINSGPLGLAVIILLAIMGIAIVFSVGYLSILLIQMAWVNYQINRIIKKEQKIEALRKFHEDSQVNKPISEVDSSIDQNAFGGMVN